MLSTAVSDDPLSLHSAMRSFIADAITPISAFLALAQPGRSCLLESVEGTDRISRYSFIGLDYLEARVFDDDPAMLAEIRALIGKYRRRHVGAAVSRRRGLRVHLRRRARARADRPEAARRTSRSPTRWSSCPGTWVVFDHFTHRVTLIGFARDGASSPRSARGSPATSERLLTARAERSARRPRARRRRRSRWTARRYLERVATREAAHLRRRRLPVAGRHPVLGDRRRRHGVRFLPADPHAQSLALHVLHRARRRSGVRRVAGVSRAARRPQRAPAAARGNALARRRSGATMRRSRPNCSPTRKNAPST